MPIALVTGASRGVGKGIATALHDAGYRVFATGRTIDSATIPPGIIRIPCNHTDAPPPSGSSRRTGGRA